MDQPRTSADTPTRRERFATRTAALILGAGAVALGAAWLFRAPLASAAARQALMNAGIASAFRLTRLDFGGVALEDVRLGDPAAPDATIRRAFADFTWTPLPRVSRYRLEAPILRARFDESGVSFGALDPLLHRASSVRKEPSLPDITLEIADGRGIVETPFGALELTAQSQGALRRDFVGDVRLARASPQKGANALRDAEGALSLRADAGALRGNLHVALGAARMQGLALEGARLDADLTTDPSLRGAGAARLSANLFSSSTVTLNSLQGEARVANASGEGWSGQAALRANASGRAHWNAPDTEFRAVLDVREGLVLRGELRAPHLALTRSGRAALADAWTSLGAFPFGPLLAGSRDATIAMLSDAELKAPFALAEQSLTLSSLDVAGASGARIRLRASRNSPSALTVNLRAFGASGSGAIETEGAGLPVARLDVRELTIARGGMRARADLSIPDYRANGAALRAPILSITLDHSAGRGAARIRGDALMSGPMGGAHVEGLAAPLNLSVSWGEGLRIASGGGPCIAMRFATLTLPGLTFVNGAAPICAEGEAFYAMDANRVVGGGFSMAPTSWSGRMGEDASTTALLTIQGIQGRLSGATDRLVLDTLIQAPTLDVRFASDQGLRAAAPQLDAQLVTTADGWRAHGLVANGVLEDATLPAHVTEIAGRWTAAPRGGDAQVLFEGGAARLTGRDRIKAGDDRPVFNPVRVTHVAATIEQGRVLVNGLVTLEEGARRLASFEATHTFESGAGEATIRTDDFAFGASLQPYEITELARGAVENVRGLVATTIHAHWTPDTFAADGLVRLDNVSLASSTLPIVEGVSGEIRFDDLLTPKTAPSQRLTVALLNPGVAVRDGTIDFQLLDAGRVVIERAEWPFAGGALSVTPTMMKLGAEETRLTLTMTHVDVATLLAELKAPDLAATGRVGGTFPLLLTAEAARVENGALQAEGGGTIAYAGRAGEETRGVARLAFDALKQFRYDNLSLVLNGDLAGDLLTEIRFRGASAAGVELPGVGSGPWRARLGDVPFVFNVSVRAPFRRLGELTAGAFDPKRALGQARGAERPRQDESQAIDPAAPPNR